jgi:lipopolysaccharide transport system ATP-binding protein
MGGFQANGTQLLQLFIMTMRVISCDHVFKIFKRNTGQRLLRHHVASWFDRHQAETFFALKDVTFSLQKGQSLGICGGNGAGKSTLLNLIAGLGRPDKGNIEVNGRVSALLELGSGFHPDLTGAENLKINAALSGLTRRQTAALFDSIIEFSGIGEFIDEPLRTYSSGMVLRLAFSVAIMVDPDILVVDEIFAVGDQTFQAKCQERIRSLRQRGATLVCVSHSPGTLVDLCDEGIWLDHGQVMFHGKIRDVLNAYQGHPTTMV